VQQRRVNQKDPVCEPCKKKNMRGTAFAIFRPAPGGRRQKKFHGAKKKSRFPAFNYTACPLKAFIIALF
jgi:hypothetical protein